MQASDLARSNALALLARHARTKPTAVAFRSKHLGIYRERTWRDYAGLVARAAAGLKRLGVTRGERVAIMGDPCEEWMLADLGAQAVGAISYGIYPTASASEVEYQLRDAGASVFVAQDQEYVDRILPFADRLPALRFIVVVDTSAMFSYEHPKIRGWSAVLGEASAGDDELAALEALAAAIAPGDPAFIVYTSGTTGHPKGALVAHGRHLAGAYNLVQHYPVLAEPQRTVVYLPLCHVLGRDVALTLPLLSGLVPHFGEDGEDLAQTIFEVAPTVLFTVPRYLQKFAARALVAVQNSSRPKRLVYDAAMRVGRRRVRAHWEGRAGGPGRLVYALARGVAFRPLLNKLGFDALELVISGGAPLPPETMALWQIWGVNVCEIYGQTEEAGAIITGQRERFPRPGDVGTLGPGWELKLAPSGEILIRGEHRFESYWGNEAATREVQAEDGWLHTGDVGEWKDGRLRLDRSGARLHRHRRRQDAGPGHDREHHARQPLRRRGRRHRARAEVPDRARGDRLRHGLRLGARSRHRVHRLHQSRRAPPRPGADRGRGGARQCAAGARGADQGVPHPAQGARPRGRGRAGDADAEGEARADVRALPRSGRVDVHR